MDATLVPLSVTVPDSGRSMPARLLDGGVVLLALFLLVPPLVALVAAGLFHINPTALLGRALLTSLGLGAASAVLAFVVVWPLASLAVLAVYCFGVIPWRATKHFKQNRFLAHAAEFRIDETGLHVRSDLGASDIPWDHLHKWKENKRLILLYPTDAMYYLFSRRLFTAEEWEEFRGLAAKHLKKIR